jgi:hypothetical protein
MKNVLTQQSCQSLMNRCGAHHHCTVVCYRCWQNAGCAVPPDGEEEEE